MRRPRRRRPAPARTTSMASEISPTRIAESPSHSMKVPGAMSSTASRMPPRMNQFQTPSEAIVGHHGDAPSGRVTPGMVGVVGRCGGRRGRRVAGAAAGLLAAESRPWRSRRCRRATPSTPVASIGSIRIFWLGDCAISAERLEVFLGDEVVERRDIAAGDRLAHHLGRLGLGLGEALARLGVAERRLPPAFGFEDLPLLLAFGAQDRGLPLAFGRAGSRRASRARPSSAGPSTATRSAGGTMSLISMRLTLTPHGDTAASTTRNSRSLISSRCDSIWSRSIAPMTERMLVIVSLTIA